MLIPDNSFTCRRLLSSLISILIATLVSDGMPVRLALAQDECETALADAQKMYAAGSFTSAIELLNQCLPDGIREIEKVQAYRLLALSHLQEDYPDQAKEAINKLLDQDKNYKPDPVNDPQNFIDLFEEVKAARPKSLGQKLFGGMRKYYWIGGGALLAAGIIRNNLPKDEREPDLPGPPDLPK